MADLVIISLCCSSAGLVLSLLV